MSVVALTKNDDREKNLRKGMGVKLICLMVFLQCFQYKYTDFVPVLDLGLTVSPDRFVFVVIFMVAIWKLMSGELRYAGLGKVGWCMLIVSTVITVSTYTIGDGSRVLFYLFDFCYNPLTIFLLAKSIPHSKKKLETLSLAFILIGVYMGFNGAFEHFGIHTLVWPKYILDPHVGIQFGRTRGSFASSENLGMALVTCFLFYALYTTYVEGGKQYFAYLMILIIAGVIYTTNQRAAWVNFGLSLFVLAFAKTKMKRVAWGLLGMILVVFVIGVGTHLSLWDTTLFSKRQNTVDYRKVNNETTLEMGMANPIFGVGYGNFRNEWSKYFKFQAETGVSDLTDGNHNTFLGIFSEVGLVGLIPYLLMLYYMARLGLQVYFDREGLEKHFSLVCLLVFVSYMFGANFSDYRSGPFFNTTLFLLFGCIAAIDMQKRRDIPNRDLSARTAT